ncbi:MAG TPA: sucrose phosphorylase, partial [Spirochaetia bacterium]|nr:sucrose phosphorylase [Spirochaetia bacterium]
ICQPVDLIGQDTLGFNSTFVRLGDSMSVRNEVILITYADSLGSNLAELHLLLEKYFRREDGGHAIGGVHVLPFFPSSADRGFAPVRYDEVDPELGSWADIAKLAEHYELTVDFMINHLSRRSPQFEDFLRRKDRSPYAKMFIRYKDFWPNGRPTDGQVELIYKRKPRAPAVEIAFADGTAEEVWCTFDEEQIDLDLRHEVTREFVRASLIDLAERGARIIRLDAFAYSIKKAGTTCFFVEPEIWELLEWARNLLAPFGVEILPEIHEHYSIQQKLADRGYWVYDFALPMLLLHTLYTASNKRLLAWLEICPRKQFTTLDTHDGIGVVDVFGLLSESEIERVRDELFNRQGNAKQVYNTPAYKNLDIYQINCTYYSALGADDDSYLLARVIQFFAPGIPQVYYVGLLAGENDIDLVERTRVGRDINRHRYTSEEVAEEVSRSVVRRLIRLMRFRNSYPAFTGEFHVGEVAHEGELRLSWQSPTALTELTADLKLRTFTIRYRDPDSGDMRLLDGV